MSDFKREERYIVIKLTDLKGAPLSNMERNVLDDVCRHVSDYRHDSGKSPLQCVVVESDWPEYEPTWAAIEARMSQQSAQQNAEGPIEGCATLTATVETPDRKSSDPSAPTAPDRDALVKRLQEMRTRLVSLAVDYAVGDQFDGDFQNIDDAIAALTAPADAGVVVPRNILARIDTNLRAGRITQSDLNEIAALLTAASGKESK